MGEIIGLYPWFAYFEELGAWGTCFAYHGLRWNIFEEEGGASDDTQN